MNTMTRAVLFAALLMLAAGLAPNALAEAKILGTWDMMSADRGGVRYEITMTIEDELVRVTSRCTYGADTLEVVVSAPSEITADQLLIKGTDRQSKSYRPGSMNCSATIKQADLGWSLQDGKLVLTDPSRPKPLVMARAKD